MLPLALAALALGLIFLFIIPWAGLAVGLVGLLLLIVYLVGAARRPAEPRA